MSDEGFRYVQLHTDRDVDHWHGKQMGSEKLKKSFRKIEPETRKGDMPPWRPWAIEDGNRKLSPAAVWYQRYQSTVCRLDIDVVMSKRQKASDSWQW